MHHLIDMPLKIYKKTKQINHIGLTLSISITEMPLLFTVILCRNCEKKKSLRKYVENSLILGTTDIYLALCTVCDIFQTKDEF